MERSQAHAAPDRDGLSALARSFVGGCAVPCTALDVRAQPAPFLELVEDDDGAVKHWFTTPLGQPPQG